MAEIVLFHHVHGLTPGCLAFAEELRAAGHVVHTPDLFEGATFEELSAGIAHADEVGFETVLERGRQAAEALPSDVVYAGFSLGVMPAQLLAQTRPGARGAVLMHGAIPPEELDSEWPSGVPLQIHVMEDDELGDVDIARRLAAQIDGAELYLYPGSDHLFTDSSLAVYDAEATSAVKARMLAFLDRVG